MRIRWRNFELPSKVQPDSDSMTSVYGRFSVEPFERGFGHTIGNGLRRVLLSSIEGTAVTSVKIEGAEHEFASMEGVYEDVTDIVLNLKRLRVQFPGKGTLNCRIDKSKKGAITGADVICSGDAIVVNRDLHIATLTADRELKIAIEIKKGRGYVPAEDNVAPEQPLGTIPVDSIYSPVHRVRYAVEATRVGKYTNYDRLVMEIWTDGTITPQMALTEAAKIYRKHLNPFVLLDSSRDQHLIGGTIASTELASQAGAEREADKLLDRPITALELSVRARNCLDSANIQSLRDLVSLSEEELMGLKNLGKTSLEEILKKLKEHDLSLGMKG
jgi:DNA-directed RNA polymerase subunit alpha